MISTKSFGSVFSTFWISMCQELDVMFITKVYKLLKDTIQNMLHEWQVPSLPVPYFFEILTSNFFFSKEHAKSLREKISPNKTFNESYYGPMFGQAESHGTAHVSVIGPDGELVSVTRCVEGLHYI